MSTPLADTPNCRQLDGSAALSPSVGEKRTRRVVLLTAVAMVAEIAAGAAWGSMALLADGWHMASHAAALGISLFAYAYARRHAANPEYAFGTGKVNALGGFTSALLLGMIALGMIWEAGSRLVAPVAIRFDQSIVVAVIGLGVNAVSLMLLGGHGHDHEHAHDHHDHDHEHHHHGDLNLRAAYMHVLADLMTSVLAIGALMGGKLLGLAFLDPAVGVLGAVVILRWSWQLVRASGRELLDGGTPRHLIERVRRTVQDVPQTRVVDLHVWRVSPTQHAVIVSVETPAPHPPAYYKELLAAVPELSHITVEVNPR